MATGNSNTSLSVCTDMAADHYGGVEVFARDGGRGASRVMCPPTELLICQPPDCDPPVEEARTGFRRDNNLNGRNQNVLPAEDIWNGFHKEIESFRLRASAGCSTRGVLLGRVPDPVGDPDVLLIRHLDNYEGATPVARLFEVPDSKDDKAWGVIVSIDCPL